MSQGNVNQFSNRLKNKAKTSHCLTASAHGYNEKAVLKTFDFVTTVVHQQDIAESHHWSSYGSHLLSLGVQYLKWVSKNICSISCFKNFLPPFEGNWKLDVSSLAWTRIYSLCALVQLQLSMDKQNGSCWATEVKNFLFRNSFEYVEVEHL